MTMAQKWVYKATPTIANLNDTRDLAAQECFLAKAAHERPNEQGHHARADHVKDVLVGDVIHFYFREIGTTADNALPIGSFEVVGASPVPGRFTWPVEETHLARVLDPAFDARLQKMGYGRDPKLGFTTGWLLRRLDQHPPPYDRTWFPGNHVLRKYS
ncbi:hypothetical protein WMF39_25715 [Sorangium sp. So ce1504]|uniref:hypothetical protein n=1 Tax=Sorangium sp. So ce1504 TaxID=3133337 RepID=UPI003F6189D9